MDEIARVTPIWRGVSYETLRERRSLQYPVPTPDSDGTPFLFADRLPHRRRPGTFVPVEYLPPNELPSEEYPFVLNTGRQMYHWHTGTMTRRSEGWTRREPVPIVEMHVRSTRRSWAWRDGDTVGLTTAPGRQCCIGVRVSDRQARGQVFMPMHFREAAANLLTNPQLDPYARSPPSR